MVCDKEIKVAPKVLNASRAYLSKDTSVKPVLGGTSSEQLDHLLIMWLKTQTVAAFVEKRNRKTVAKSLAALERKGILVASGEPTDASCVVYVDFKRRFGGDKATCLK